MTVVCALKLKQLAAFARSRERSDALPRVPFQGFGNIPYGAPQKELNLFWLNSFCYIYSSPPELLSAF